jgi:hypothetical protein
VLVLVSFVLVLAAAVTLVVGLLQSGLTLIYLSIGCSVLAGVVLAVAVLRGRPEARPATAGRSFSPPQRAEVPAAVGASSATETTSSWSSPPVASTPAPTPAPPPPARAPASASASASVSTSSDEATKAAGSALLGRLRGRRAEEAGTPAPAPVTPSPVTVVSTPEETTEVPVVSAPAEDADGFPIADYDRLRATELLAQLPALDRNQLEAVRERESSGKNRFTIMSRVDSLIAAKGEPAWEAGDDEWDDEDAAVTSAGVSTDDEAALDADLANDTAGEWGVDDDEVDELVSPAAASDFPIAGYESLTVGQILPRLSELSTGELAEVRAREQQGRNRGTVLDRIDRLSSRAGARSGALAMPAAAPSPAPTRKASARKAVAPVSKTTAPAVKKARAPRVAKAVPTPEPVKATTRKAPTRKASAAPVPAPAAPAAAPARKAGTRKAAAPATPPPAPSPMKNAVKKARASKKTT